ncbi:beta strand repeat-containing protein [Nonlabens ulvanivorans]|uniref:beta strand repeat-containing protein n=1 Tax=Nonlabens ulvanivorans TaxID=906888 RepID=UPI0032996C56
MKLLLNLLCVLFLLMGAITTAQVKIGNNPNTIDPFSILELESSETVLVVTRITDAEMAAILPLNGAIIYNTSQNCLFQYRNNNWESLCNGGILVDNNDGTYTFTNDNGGIVSIDTNAIANPYNNATSGLAAMNIQDAIDELSGLASNVSLIDNADGTYTFTDAAGNTVTIADTSISTLIDNTDGTYTYTDELGNQTIIDTSFIESLTSLGLNASQTGLEYTDEDGVITTLDLTTVVQNLETITTLVDNTDGTFTYTNEAGTPVTINTNAAETLTTLVLNADDTNLDYTDEDGVTTQLDFTALVQNLETITTLVDNTDGTFTYTNEAGTPVTIDTNAAETLTTLVLNADDTNLDYTDEDGVTTQLDFTSLVQNLETITTLVDNTDGTFTYTNEAGTPVTIDTNAAETLTTLVLNADDTNLDYTDEDGVTTQLDFTDLVQNLETITTLVDNTDGTFTYTNEAGTPVTIDTNAAETLTTLVLNADDTNLDYTDEDGVTTQLDFTALVQNLETITTLVDNTDGTFTYTNEAGTPVTIDTNAAETLTTFVQDDTSATGEITYTDEAGNPSTAQVVSSDANNNIQVGLDGGAFLAGPTICAAGKILSTGTAAAGFNATASLINTGDYQITFDNDLGTTSYVIQLTITDLLGVGNDDPNISYYDQQSDGFKVNVGDNDNGGSDRADFNSEFMFSVICLPGFGNGGSTGGGGTSTGSATPTGTPGTGFNLNNFGDAGNFQLAFNAGNNGGSTWETLITNRPYSTLPSDLSATVNGTLVPITFVSEDNGDGTFNHLISSSTPLPAFNPSVTISGGATGGGAGTQNSGQCSCISFFTN